MKYKKKIQILCLQVTLWTGVKSGKKARTIGDGYKLYYKGGRPKNGEVTWLNEE